MAGVAWRAVLDRCGLTREAITAITDEGYADTDDLDLVTKETIRTLINNLRKRKEIVVPTPNPHHVTARSGAVHIPSNTENKLLALHHWIRIRSDRGEPFNSGLFQAADLKAYMIRLRNASDGDDKDSAELVAKPSKFSNDTRFPSWQRKLTNYLGDKNGKTGTPLSYVIREEDAVLPPAEVALLATAHERAIMSTNLAGPSYESDNGRVWGLLQELCEGGPAWSFIAKCSTARDGREAFKALVVHYEGAAQQSRSKQAAYVILASSTYDGERKHHSFEMFINKLTSAYQDLSDYKEDVAEGKKVRDFLEAIKTPALDAGKAQVIANPNTYNTLESVTNYLAHFVKSQSTMQRKVAAVDRGGRGDGGRGRGRGRGPGGRGGRGRGRGGRCPKPTVSARNFSDEEWPQFSGEEQAEVVRLRDEKKRKRAAGISAIRSATDADDDDAAEDEAGTLMKSVPKKKKGK
jgi:hypothetical protein